MMVFQVARVDDLDGLPVPDGMEPVRFRFDGVEYEIDLTEVNRRRLRAVFRPYVDAARRRSYRATVLPRAERRPARSRL